MPRNREPRESWRRHKFSVSAGDLQLSDNYGRRLAERVGARSTSRHRANILSWLERASLSGHASNVDERERWIRAKSKSKGKRGRKGCWRLRSYFGGYKQELWSVYVAMDAKGSRFSAGLRVIFFCSVTTFPFRLFFSFFFFFGPFPSLSFFSLLSAARSVCPMERAAVTFEICWEKKEAHRVRGRMILWIVFKTCSSVSRHEDFSEVLMRRAVNNAKSV